MLHFPIQNKNHEPGHHSSREELIEKTSEPEFLFKKEDADTAANNGCCLTPFWKTSLKNRFILVEFSFYTSRITSDISKFHLTITGLTPEIIYDIDNVLHNLPETGKYVFLKSQILSRLSASPSR